MLSGNYKTYTVGHIVAERFETAQVFARHGIDFCCHGNVPFEEACQKRNVNPETVARELDSLAGTAAAPTFNEWPIDLLVDYVLKIHHRGIRTLGPQTAELLAKVVDRHSANHPELHEVQSLFNQALEDLENHLQKEEHVLLPYICEMSLAQEENRKAMPFHCGTVQYPITVMEEEHGNEGLRFERIAALTGNFSVPEDACPSYRLAMQQLRQFKDALHEHIHLENNIIFPKALEMERTA